MTTRSHSIASMMGTVPSHILEGLSQKDSSSLFVKWAFKEGEEEKHPHLVNIGEEIVKKCRGVPLALRTLGSLLFLKFEASEWEYVRENEIWNMPQKSEDILPALKLSYDLMPSYLRQCFALFSLYPKDCRFDSIDMTSLWGALGLIALPKENRTLEDVANQYLKELHSRSFLQDFQNFHTFDTFRLHDLVHDLALFVANDECLHVNSNTQSIPDNVRHLSFAESRLFGNLVIKKSVAVRTVLFPNGAEDANGEALLNTCLSKFKCLRALSLRGAIFETLPRTIAKLKHLRYLDIGENLKIKRLPESICKLQSLQVLNLSGCMELEALPKGLRKLISLRHLEFSVKQSVLPVNEIASLGSLETLGVNSCYNVESVFGGVKFPALKALYVLECHSIRSLSLDGKKFPQLETLFVDQCHNLESIFGGVKFPALKALYVQNCQSLKSLPLDGKIFPQLESFFVVECDNLDLELWKGHREEQRPKLKLKLVAFLSLSQLVALPEWLQEAANSLQCLRISNCENIETLPNWLTTMTDLKTLDIRFCSKLISLPDDIHHLTALESLRIEDCAELWKKYEPHVGEFWAKISHIKDVVIIEPEELLEESVKE